MKTKYITGKLPRRQKALMPLMAVLFVLAFLFPQEGRGQEVPCPDSLIINDWSWTQSCSTPFRVTFTDESIVNPPGFIDQYYWRIYYSDGTFDGSYSQNYTHQFDSAGLYQIIHRVRDTSGCYKWPVGYSRWINVIPPPTAGFSYTPATQQCADVPVLFDAQYSNIGAGGSGDTTYKWSYGNGMTDSLITASMTYSPGIYDVRLIVSDTNGCADTTTKQITVVGCKCDKNAARVHNIGKVAGVECENINKILNIKQ